MKDMSNLNKILIIALVIVIVFLAFWKISGFFIKDDFAGIFTTSGMRASPDTPYNKNTIEMRPHSSGYFIIIKEVMGTTGEHMYYNLDITLDTPDYYMAKMMVDNRAKTVTVIREVMMNSKNEDLNNQKRDELKSKIIQGIATAYNNKDAIGDVYFEKFLYK